MYARHPVGIARSRAPSAAGSGVSGGRPVARAPPVRSAAGMTRTPVALALATGALALLPAAASAAVTCAYDGAAHRLTVATDGDHQNPMIGRSGSQIAVTSNGLPVSCSGAAPTVTNTDEIDFTDGSPNNNALAVDLQGGPLAPGFSSEGQFGTPEIEIDVHTGGGYDILRLFGTAGADAIRAGTFGSTETRVNLNPADAIPDADIKATGVEAMFLHGEDGKDVLRADGGAGTADPLLADVTVFGHGEDDTLHGGGGSSVLAGGAGDDEILGGSSLEHFYPGPGDDLVDGGDGIDYLFVDPALPGVHVDLADGEVQDTGEGSDRLLDLEGAVGTDSADVLRGTGAVNYLQGKGGDDIIEGRGGSDSIDGGDGADVADYHDAGGPVTVDLAAPAPNASGAEGGDTLVAVEDVDGGASADVIRGSDGENRLEGGAGADTLESRGGKDELAGEAGDDLLDGGLGADEIDGGLDVDTITYVKRSARVAVRLDGVRNDGADPSADGVSGAAEEGDRDIAIENATGGSGADRLGATAAAANRLRGSGGADVLDGGGLGADVLDGGLGIDTLTYAARAGAVAVTLNGLADDGADPDRDGISTPAEEADQDKGIENATGGAGRDRLTALGAAAAILTGGGASDRLNAKDGSATPDHLDCGAGGEDTYAGDPADTASGCEVIQAF